MKRISLPDSPRILIVKLSAVGDIVHTLPALNALRQAFPHAHIGWAMQPIAANLLEGHPQINELILLPRKLRIGWRELRNIAAQLKGNTGGWDVAIDFQGLTKSGAVAWLSGAPQRIGLGNEWSREANRLFMTSRVSPAATEVIRMNIGLLEPLGIAPDSQATAVLHVTEADRQKIATWEKQQGVVGERFLFLDPFAGWPTKLWEPEKWVEVAGTAFHRFGMRPLIFHGPGEAEHAHALAQEIAPEARAVVAPPTTLREYVALLQGHARAMVAADTGPMHIAAAAGVPVAGLFGPSDSKRNAPAFRGTRFELLQDFSQPCAGTNVRACRFHPQGKCMSSLTPAMVIAALEKLLT